MNLEQWPLEKLIPYISNSRTHSDTQISQIAASIREFGFTNPVLIDKDGGIIAGHGRVIAAKKLSMPEVPCIVLGDLSEAQKKAYVIADNQLALNAGWDFDLLKVEIEGLEELDFDLELLGFDDGFLDGLLEPLPEKGLTDEDECPEPPETPVSVLGDVWILDNHRLMCGDSTSIDAVEKLMDGQKADMSFTSPPYNGDTNLSGVKLYENNTDQWTSEEYIEFCHISLNNLFLYTDGFIFWNVSYNAKSRGEYIAGVYPYISKLWETIIWCKTGMPIKDGLTRNTEFIFCFKNGSSKKHLGKFLVTEFTLWKVSNLGAQTESHRACFPVELPQKGIELGSETGWKILDLFGGSGSTLIACEKTNRKCYMMELDEKYCDLIINRWQNFTGKKATHAETGKTFDDVSNSLQLGNKAL